ncbi:MAG: TadE/TadG family type IV pilus assembly protein, partial [Miltoncostaeaceae bacterium]
MRRRMQRGQAAIETVILAPLLVLALGSGLGLALAAADWVSAAGAARVGARAAEMSLP